MSAVAGGSNPSCCERGDDLLQLAATPSPGAPMSSAWPGVMVPGAGGHGGVRHGIPHVCVPAGTRNHFALDLGLDRDDVVGALDAFLDGVERRVDLARVNGRVFVNNASMGLYAKIVQSPAYRGREDEDRRRLAAGHDRPDARPFDLRFLGPDGVEYPTAHLVLVSNDPYELDHSAGGARAPGWTSAPSAWSPLVSPARRRR